MYEALTKHIEELDNPGHWVVDDSDGDIYHLPYVSFRDEICGFIREAAQHVVYDYMDVTQRIREDQNVDCIEDIDVANLCANEILALITYGIQADRFC